MPNTVQLLNDHAELLVTYGTIQAAVDASSDGWTVTASAGTYDEHVILNSDVTLQGANAGLDVADNARGPETIITGGVELSADGVTVDGVTISGSFETTVFPSIGFQGRAGLVIEGADATIENSVFTGDAIVSGAFVTTTSSLTPSDFPTGLTFAHNLVQGWNQAATLILGSDGSITHNTFSGNLAGSITEEELSAFHVSDNSFSGSSAFAADVSGTTPASLDLSDFVHDNTYSAVAQPIHVELSGPDGQVVTGTDTSTVFDVSTHVGAAEVHGGAGSDTISYIDALDPATIDLGAGTALNPLGSTSSTSIENAVGAASGGDNITGNAAANMLDGDGGNDTIAGKDGNDTLIGGIGNDLLDGGDGNDTASYADAAAGVNVSLALTTAQNTGGAGVDTLTGIENLTGSAFNDSLASGFGDNKLSGLAGDDVLAGGDGNDSLDGGAGNDTASYEDADMGVIVNLALTTTQYTAGGGFDTLISIEGVIGSNLDDTLTGDAGNNVLGGLDGDDLLNGGAGDDILDGGIGVADTASYVGAAAGVTVSLAIASAQNTVGAGTDTLIGIKNLTGSALNDTLTGNASNNVLDGGAGNDTLSGGAGTDDLYGGAGNNTLVGGEATTFSLVELEAVTIP